MKNGGASKKLNSPFGASELITSLTEQSKVFLFAYSTQLKNLVSWTPNAKEILGVDDERITKDSNLFLRHVHPDDRFLLMKDLELALANREEYRATYRWIRPDNQETRWVHCRANYMEREDDQAYEGFMIDLSEEFTGSVGSLAGPDSIGTVLSVFSTTVLILDQDLRIIRINKPKEQKPFDFGDPQFNFENFRIGRYLIDCFSNAEIKSHYQKELDRVLLGKEKIFTQRIASTNRVYNIEIRPLNNEANKNLLLSITDISESVNLERRLAELQKTEGLRLLAAAVSHNFNNALQSILGQAAIIKNHSDNTKLVQEACNSITDIIKRTSDLTKQLHKLDHTNKEELVPVDLNLTLMAAINKVDNLFSSGTKIDVTFGSPGVVLAVQEELIDCITSVLKNARDFLASKGQISVRTEDVTLDEFEIEDLPAGNYSKLSITDTGQGMEEEAKLRCLEPFFTTKEKDPATGVGLKGEGLGLSSTHGVIRKFNGALNIKTSIGTGTNISIYLPHKNKNRNKTYRSKPSEAKDKNPKILVIDDDRTVLKTMSAILKRFRLPISSYQ